jgi:hypothetical protein
VSNLGAFQRFLALLAGRVGQILDHTSLAGDTGISPGTSAAWLSILEASYLVHTLRPYHNNFGKRYIKRPKVYCNYSGLGVLLVVGLLWGRGFGWLWGCESVGEYWVCRANTPDPCGRIQAWRETRRRTRK